MRNKTKENIFQNNGSFVWYLLSAQIHVSVKESKQISDGILNEGHSFHVQRFQINGPYLKIAGKLLSQACRLGL